MNPWLQMQNKDGNFSEEKIALATFHSADDLKDEIGTRVKKRQQTDWDFIGLNICGPYLFLKFKQRFSGIKPAC